MAFASCLLALISLVCSFTVPASAQSFFNQVATSPLSTCTIGLTLCTFRGHLVASCYDNPVLYLSADGGATWSSISITYTPIRGNRYYQVMSSFTPLTGTYANKEILVVAGGITHTSQNWPNAGNVYWVRDMWVATDTTLSFVQTSTETNLGTGNHCTFRRLNSLYRITGQDVAYTSDGISWNEVSVTSSWFTTSFNAAATVDSSGSRIILIGGRPDTLTSSGTSNVWISNSDITAWTLLASSPGFAGRYNHGAWMLDGYTYVAGGRTTSSGSALSDAWVTTDDGKTWILVSSTAFNSSAAVEMPVSFDVLGRSLVTANVANFYAAYAA